MATTRRFPRLVEQGFEVKVVQSSCPDPNPFPGKGADNTYEILTRMTPDKETARYYNAMLEETRSIDIMKNIKDVISKDTFRPVVHAELLILQSLEQDEFVHPSNFFGSWKYIGSSKPTCWLSHYYFQIHKGRFQVRSTHMNLYLNWKAPDVFGRDGDAAIKAREDMMNAMVKPIRQDGHRTLEERIPLGSNMIRVPA